MAWIIALQVSQLQHCQGLLHRNRPAFSHRLLLCLDRATVHKHESRQRKVYQIWRKLASYRLHQRKNEPISFESEYAALCEIGGSESLVAQVYKTRYREQLNVETSREPFTIKCDDRDISCFRIRPRTWPEDVKQPEVIPIAADARAETSTLDESTSGFWYESHLAYSTNIIIRKQHNTRKIIGVFLGEGSTLRHNVFASRVATGPTLNTKLYQKLPAAKDGTKRGNDKQVHAVMKLERYCFTKIFLMIRILLYYYIN